MVRAIRGATTVENNDREEIIEATKEMLETIISENNIKTEDMVSVIFIGNCPILTKFSRLLRQEKWG